MHKRIFLLILLFTLMALTLTACDKDETLSFQASSTNESVDIRSIYKEEGGVIFFIFSPEGGGDADILLRSGDMPDVVQVRLFGDGLENLELTYGEVKIIASVTPDGVVTTEKVVQNGAETDIDTSSPYWIAIQPLPAESGGIFVGEPMLPASFLITLPADFHKSGADHFTLSWGDRHQ